MKSKKTTVLSSSSLTSTRAVDSVLRQLALLAIAISIYDLPHDPKSVVIEACSERCVSIVVPRADLEEEGESEVLLLDEIASLILRHLK